MAAGAAAAVAAGMLAAVPASLSTSTAAAETGEVGPRASESSQDDAGADRRPEGAGPPETVPGPPPRDDQQPPGVAVRTVDGFDDDWPGEPTWVAGTAGYDAGVWSYTDYPYSDVGTGAFAYPDDGDHGNNAADPVVVQVALGKDAVHYLVRLNTLLRPDTTVVALAVDTDVDLATGGDEWPYNAKIDTAGWDHLVTAWGSGGTVTTHDGQTTNIEVVANTTENLMEFAVPYEVADPEGAVWRYRGAAGLWDAEAGQWAEVATASPTDAVTEPVEGTSQPTGKSDEGEPNAFKLLFRSRTFDGGSEATDENDSSGFQSARQQDALGAGDLGDFQRDVDFSVLAAAESRPPDMPTEDHDFTRVVDSPGFDNDLPEGVHDEGPTGSLYNGRYQPYRLFVPATYWAADGPVPMLPLLHGWLGDHRGFTPGDGDFWNEVVRANGAVVPKPLGRGQEIWYEHIGELDVLEVIDDVTRHYDVDEDRIHLGGTSMGGLGSVKIGQQHPELFAGIFPSVPPMSDRAQGYALPENNDWDLVELAPSLRNVPVRNFIGTIDGLVPGGHDPQRLCDALEELVYDHDCWREVTGGHSSYNDERAAELARLVDEHRRVADPARVVYQSHPAFRRQADRTGLDHLLRYDRAYWVSGLEWPDPPVENRCSVADCVEQPGIPDWPTDPGTIRRLQHGSELSWIDVRTHGLGLGPPDVAEIEDVEEPTTIRSGLVLTPGPAVAPRNELELTVNRVLAADLDLERMGLTLGDPLTAELAGDGALDLGLKSDAEGCVATFDGARLPLARDGDRLVTTVPLTPEPGVLEVQCTG